MIFKGVLDDSADRVNVEAVCMFFRLKRKLL